MKLYKDSGTNPFASCLPILLQMPIFLALFRLIDQAAKNPRPERACMTEHAERRSSATRSLPRRQDLRHLPQHRRHRRAGAGRASSSLAMTATTFLTQRQLMSKNMPADALSGPYAQQQKMLLYVLPVVFAVGGIAFPIGVLFYWTTSNLWTMGQQFYVIRNNPAPGTPAAKAKEERDRDKAERKGLKTPAQIEEERSPPRPRRRREEKPQPRGSSRSGRPRPSATRRRSADPDLPDDVCVPSAAPHPE